MATLRRWLWPALVLALALLLQPSTGWTKGGKEKTPDYSLEEMYTHPGIAYGGYHRAVPIVGEDSRVKSFRQPYLPIIVPPEVMKVWVPDHLNSEGDLVQGHWVFLKREARWYIQVRDQMLTKTPPMPTATGKGNKE